MIVFFCIVFVLDFSFSFHKRQKTCSICLCRSDLFHWIWSFIPSIFHQMTKFLSSLCLNKTPMCTYIAFLVTVHLTMGMYADSIVWLLWIVL
jgi:hypothetical protein